jgi:hypothetical protein
MRGERSRYWRRAQTASPPHRNVRDSASGLRARMFSWRRLAFDACLLDDVGEHVRLRSRRLRRHGNTVSLSGAFGSMRSRIPCGVELSEDRHENSGATAAPDSPSDSDARPGRSAAARRAVEWAAHGVALISIGFVLVAVGQPIFSDDTWWHLALGEAHAESGPLLAEDPLLFTAEAPPPPTSWLADLVLHSVWTISGFTGLRVFHLSIVLWILALAWSMLRNASRSAALASIGTALFAVMSAYRFVQLRPHLVTILAIFLIHRLLLSGSGPVSWTCVGASVLLMGLWANMHAAYPFGPVLLAVIAAGLFVVSFSRAGKAGRVDRRRASRVAAASLLGVLATMFHPMGIEGYRKVLSIGSGAESVAFVADEWGATDLFSLPSSSLPPSLLNWMLVWFLLLGAAAAAVKALRHWRRPASMGEDAIDPVIVVLAGVSLVMMLGATRFFWLSVFPLCLVFCALRPRFVRSIGPIVAGLVGLALIPGLLVWGDWPMVTRGLPATLEGYRQPYAARKYHASAVWFLADANLTGSLFGRYAEGGFQSFWLQPAIRTAMNGTLNMRHEALQASLAIRERIGTPAHPRFEDALDALGVDLFVGTGLPVENRPGRPPNYMTVHLEQTAGWLPIFRNLDSAIYLRLNERNVENLERVAAYYAERGVPFDREHGFDPADALRSAPAWARSRGIWTGGKVSERSDLRNVQGLGRIASRSLALGLYEEAAAVNSAVLEMEPANQAALERRVWLLVRPGRRTSRESLEHALRELADRPTPTSVSNELIEVARRVLEGEPIAPRRLWMLPAFTREDARELLAGIDPPELR